MQTKPKQYRRMTADASPRSPVARNCLKAFFIGGAICTVGQFLWDRFEGMGLPADTARGLVSVSLIFLSILLTALGVYDRLARQAGAGTLVPITGFANAVAAPAMEFRSEGLVPGLAAKMFVIAGPVLVYGTLASVIYGVILWAAGLL